MGKQQGSLGSNGGGGKLQALAMVGIILNILTNQTSPVRRLWKGSFFPNSEFSGGLRLKVQAAECYKSMPLLGGLKLDANVAAIMLQGTSAFFWVL